MTCVFYVKTMNKNTNRCSNPLSGQGKKLNKHSNKFSNVTVWMCNKYAKLKSDDKICSSCKIKMYRIHDVVTRSHVRDVPRAQSEDNEEGLMPLPPENDQPQPSTSKKNEGSPFKLPLREVVKSLDISAEACGQSPFDRRKLRSYSYVKSKVDRLATKAKKLIYSESKKSKKITLMEQSNKKINSLKKCLLNKFNSVTTKNEKLQVMTIAVPIMTETEITALFGTTRSMTRTAKDLFKKKGFMSMPDKKKGRPLAPEIVASVIAFYLTEPHSRPLPGMTKRDAKTVTVNEGGTSTKVTLQCRLLLDTLDELYNCYTAENPGVKIGLTKFSQLRPTHVVFAQTTGAHSVCVCTKHQNLKLMMVAARIPFYSSQDNKPIKNREDLISRVMCNPPRNSCYLRECSECPKIDDLKEELIDLLEKYHGDKVRYSKCMTTGEKTKFNRCTIVPLEQNHEEFVESMCKDIEIFIPHYFVDKMQSMAIKEMKESLKDGEFLAIGDFAENYAFVTQDAAQAFHWNNSQATLHTFVVYYRENDKLKHYNHVVISECHDKHNTITVYMCQTLLIARLKAKFHTVNKIYYFTDGAASQYKNRKNFLNLFYHKKDFNVEAEGHFFATSHGKGPADGLSGSVKRLARNESLRRPYIDQIITAKQLYDWAIKTFENIFFDYTTEKDYNKYEKKMNKRFLATRTVSGTLKYHCVIPNSNKKSKPSAYMKIFSTSTDSKLCSLVV